MYLTFEVAQKLQRDCSSLKSENEELKKQLAELKQEEVGTKRIPPKGQEVRDKKNGRIYYSAGSLSPDGLLRVHYEKDNYYASDAEIHYWEEIEVKVKIADT